MSDEDGATGRSASRILVVDDTPAVLTLIRKILAAEGYEVFVATDGAACLSRIPLLAPDLVLLDIGMPVMDGLETCRRLRLMPEGRNLPVVFLSALAAGQDKAAAFEAGGSDYVTKPVDALELKARLRTHLAKAELDRRERRLNEELERKIAERTAEIRRALDERTVLLREINHRTMNSMQILVSLADQELERAHSEETGRVVLRLQSRASAMALVYSMLSRSSDLSSIDAADFLLSLAAHPCELGSLSLEEELEPVTLDVSRAVSFGLIANELFMNAALHAYPPGAARRPLRVRLGLEDDTVTLSVEDEGRGMGPDAKPGAGLYLAELLTRQLDGTLRVGGEGGTSAILAFGRARGKPSA